MCERADFFAIKCAKDYYLIKFNLLFNINYQIFYFVSSIIFLKTSAIGALIFKQFVK